MWRNTSNFPSNVQPFFVKIWSKIMQKSLKTALCTNIGKESTFGAPFAGKQAIFRWFFGPRKALGTSRQPRRSLPFFHKFSVASGNRPGSVPGRPQGGPRRPPGTSSAAFWVDFGSIFRVDFHTCYFGDLMIFCMKFLLLCFFLGPFVCAWLWLGRPRNSIKHR